MPAPSTAGVSTGNWISKFSYTPRARANAWEKGVRMRLRTLGLWVVLSLLFGTHTSAQLASQAALVGTVIDSDGLVVPGAQVVAVNSGTRDTYESTTNSEGPSAIHFMK